MSYSFIGRDGRVAELPTKREVYARALADALSALTIDELILHSVSKRLARIARARRERIEVRKASRNVA